MLRFSLTALVCALLVAPLSARAQSPYDQRYQPTAQDVDPGIDHTARDKDLPPEFRRTSVFYRSDYPPGTIIVNTADRFLYLIMDDNVALVTASASAAPASSAAAST